MAWSLSKVEKLNEQTTVLSNKVHTYLDCNETKSGTKDKHSDIDTAQIQLNHLNTILKMYNGLVEICQFVLKQRRTKIIFNFENSPFVYSFSCQKYTEPF